MTNRAPAGSRAGAASRRLRAHLARYYQDQTGMGGMGHSCRVCGRHCGSPHPLCDDLDALADLDAWCEPDPDDAREALEETP